MEEEKKLTTEDPGMQASLDAPWVREDALALEGERECRFGEWMLSHFPPGKPEAELRCCSDPRCRGCSYSCELGGEHDDEYDESLEVNVCSICGRESPNLGAGDTKVAPW